jgi:hypothetical protein
VGRSGSWREDRPTLTLAAVMSQDRAHICVFFMRKLRVPVGAVRRAGQDPRLLTSIMHMHTTLNVPQLVGSFRHTRGKSMAFLFDIQEWFLDFVVGGRNCVFSLNLDSRPYISSMYIHVHICTHVTWQVPPSPKSKALRLL